MAEYSRLPYTADTVPTIKEVEQPKLTLLLVSSFPCHMNREGLILSHMRTGESRVFRH